MSFQVHPHQIEFREGFGMTESSPITHLQPDGDAVLGELSPFYTGNLKKT